MDGIDFNDAERRMRPYLLDRPTREGQLIRFVDVDGRTRTGIAKRSFDCARVTWKVKLIE